MDHLANQNVTLSQRVEMANLGLQLANAMIEQEIAIFRNKQADSTDEDMQRVEDAINNVFAIRKEMQDLAFQISVAVI